MEVFSIEQLAVLIGVLFLMLVILVLAVRYSNKKHTERLVELKEKLKKIEKAVKGYEKNGVTEKRQLLKKIQSLERALRKNIK